MMPVTEFVLKMTSWTAVFAVSGVAGVQLAKTGLVNPNELRIKPVEVQAELVELDGRVSAGDEVILNFKGRKFVYCTHITINIFWRALDNDGVSYTIKATSQELSNLDLDDFDVDWKFKIPADGTLPTGRLWMSGHLTYSGCVDPAIPVVPFESNRVNKVAA